MTWLEDNHLAADWRDRTPPNLITAEEAAGMLADGWTVREQQPRLVDGRELTLVTFCPPGETWGYCRHVEVPLVDGEAGSQLRMEVA